MQLLAVERFVLLWGGDQGFLKEGVKNYCIAPMSFLNMSIFFLFYIYSICWATKKIECKKLDETFAPLGILLVL
jgi:hypothetical protein